MTEEPPHSLKLVYLADATLVPGNLGEGVAQNVHVIVPNGGDGTYNWVAVGNMGGGGGGSGSAH